MGTVFLPSCKLKRYYAEPSAKLRSYLEQREHVQTVGCCKQHWREANPEDDAIVVCCNCAAITQESSPMEHIRFAWEVIDQDPDFPFPDYGGERIAIQDCWRAYDRRSVQDALRSIMRKMNIEVVELPENHENTKFCGTDLLNPCTDIEKELAPKRYVEDGGAMYQPASEEEQMHYLQQHCAQIPTERVACYCTSCLYGIARGGKQPVHIIELLFPQN